MATYRDWEALQVRIGTVVRAEPNTTARNPSYRMWIEFGELGVLQSSAKLTDHYTPDDLVGRQVVAVTGFEPMRVGGFRSDVLVLGAMSPGGVVLLRPDRHVAEGTVVA
ncbi:tRNA-binding protein YgjH [bacterium BMS3Abin02]|nr:tRNA-binding protein YgjH [bacterium BMS3Abin02]HDL50338.1 tRNA-binding protein [Actinomycetota bacterium]